ncbi:4'-phosphopantetheinyl transferase superfamily protein [Candidatus Halobeggiatoa sp. HSG11]|nr:4'-phosphopantetheinyl transferase superfamily protein [Candidatus Halobeggiatoa sp. HSG11]
MLNINTDEVHLWLVFPDSIQEPELLLAYNKLLTEEEQNKKQRFHFKKHQHQYLITRALIRSVLSHYVDIKPSAWCFSKNQYGRPEVITNTLPLRFNLSHTEGLIVCGIVLKQDIGVDVETINRKNATKDIAKRFFSTQEVIDLYSKPTRSFFDYWTLKESYIKACGMGLSLPLHKFTFHIEEHIKISFNSDLHDDPNQWRFWLLEPTPSHRMAIAVRDKVNYRLNMKVIIPLVSEQKFNCQILNMS